MRLLNWLFGHYATPDAAPARVQAELIDPDDDQG
jgi:hypothetical protein